MHGLFTDIFDSLKNAGETLVESVDDIPEKWNESVDTLKKKALEFVAAFNRLNELAPIAAKDPGIKSAYDTLLERGVSIKQKIETITKGIDNVFNSVRNVFNGMDMGNLGVVPLLPIAVITGGIAIITVWLSDAYTMIKKLEALEASGANSSEIAKVLQSGSLNTTLSNVLNNSGKYLAIGLVIMVLWPTIKRKLNGG